MSILKTFYFVVVVVVVVVVVRMLVKLRHFSEFNTPSHLLAYTETFSSKTETLSATTEKFS
jgi:hypothetical protein